MKTFCARKVFNGLPTKWLAPHLAMESELGEIYLFVFAFKETFYRALANISITENTSVFTSIVQLKIERKIKQLNMCYALLSVLYALGN